jgi:hypothetical protein
LIVSTRSESEDDADQERNTNNSFTIVLKQAEKLPNYEALFKFKIRSASTKKTGTLAT